MGAQVSPAASCASRFAQMRFSTGPGLYSCRSNTCGAQSHSHQKHTKTPADNNADASDTSTSNAK